MRVGGGKSVVFGSDFPADRPLLRAYHAAFGVPSFRSHVLWRSLLACIPELSPRTILDVGCGGGGFTVSMARQFPEARITGIDYDPVALNSARVLAKVTGADNVGFIQRRLENMPAAAFDLVVAMGVLEFAADPLVWLSRLISQAGGEGVVAFTAPHRHVPRQSPRWVFGIRQVEDWMREAGFSSIFIREIVRGANRAVYRGSQAMQTHRWVALALHPFTLPLVLIDGRMPGQGEVLFCRGRRLHS